MDAVNSSIVSLLEARLNGSYQWLVEAMGTILQSRGGINDRGTLRIGFNSNYGSGYTSCVIHAPMIGSIERLPIPAAYLNVLLKFNGAKFHAITLYGILEVESNQARCLSLVAANQFWINRYLKRPPDSFYFGGRIYNKYENLGYFLSPSLEVFSALKSGQIVGNWSSIDSMLLDEYEIAQQIEIESRNSLIK